MTIVTAGSRYIDIDAYACCVAYAELLQLLGTPAKAVSTAIWNESIPKMLRSLNAPLATIYQSNPDDTYVIIDLSDPTNFDRFVDPERVTDIFDHHPGFEQHWVQRLGTNSHIEFIGAAATLIYEQWKRANRLEKMRKVSAQLLAAAILDNTLNFGARVTTDRDREAYKFLANHAKLDDAWVAAYFRQCQEATLADLSEALRNDTKFLKFAGLDDELCLGQMVIWDAKSVIAHELQAIASVLSGMRPKWMANVVSISEGRSYFVAQDDKVKIWAERLLHVQFDASIATADRLWLRKEIMKAGLAA